MLSYQPHHYRWTLNQIEHLSTIRTFLFKNRHTPLGLNSLIRQYPLWYVCVHEGIWFKVSIQKASVQKQTPSLVWNQGYQTIEDIQEIYCSAGGLIKNEYSWMPSDFGSVFICEKFFHYSSPFFFSDDKKLSALKTEHPKCKIAIQNSGYTYHNNTTPNIFKKLQLNVMKHVTKESMNNILTDNISFSLL